MSSGFYLTPSILYLNLGTEVMFVLINRMKAQKVNMEKAGNKILSDLTHVMFKKAFVDGILKPQVPLSVPTFYELFTRIVNSSVMKLDSSSMEKLFYLVLMTFKKQLFLTSSPLEIHSLTIAHMKQLIKVISDPQGKTLIESAIQQFRNVFHHYNFIHYLEIKEQLLSMLESYHSKIILFVETGFQTEKGIMIHAVRNYHNKKAIGMATNHSAIDFDFEEMEKPKNKLQLESYLSWKTDLAEDNYSDSRGSSKQLEKKKVHNEQKEKSMFDFLGLNNSDLSSYEVELDLFADSEKKNDENIEIEKGESGKEIKMEKSSEIMKKITKEFEEVEGKEEETEEVDLLQMMDS